MMHRDKEIYNDIISSIPLHEREKNFFKKMIQL